MSKALEGEHYCKEHQGNHSHYDPKNCAVCNLQQRAQRTEAECERLRVVLQNVRGALLPCPEQGELATTRKMVDEALTTPPTGSFSVGGSYG